jgi:hypothetical protein
MAVGAELAAAQKVRAGVVANTVVADADDDHITLPRGRSTSLVRAAR